MYKMSHSLSLLSVHKPTSFVLRNQSRIDIAMVTNRSRFLNLRLNGSGTNGNDRWSNNIRWTRRTLRHNVNQTLYAYKTTLTEESKQDTGSVEPRKDLLTQIAYKI